MSEDKFVSESIIRLIFDQVKASSDLNASNIKELQRNIDEVVKTTGLLATRKEVEEIVTKAQIEHFKKTDDEVKTLNLCSDDIDTIKNTVMAINTTVGEVKKSQTDILANTTKVFWAIGIALSLAITSYFVVRSTIDSQVKATIQEAVKEIITTRPFNTWPPPQKQEDVKDGPAKKN